MKNKICITILLVTAGCAISSTLIGWREKTIPVSNSAIESSVIKGFNLLQCTGATFINKAHCASCHHNTMTSMVAEKMREKGIESGDTTAGLRTMAMAGTLDYAGNPNLVKQFITAKFITPYMLVGLAAEKFPASFTTDLAVDYLLSQALPDGSFQAEYARVPLECGDIHLTAISIHAIQLYISPAKKTKWQQQLQQTRQWLEKQQPLIQQELAFQLMGMNWCGSSKTAKAPAVQKLLAMQQEDGGWSQLPTMKTDAYATGQALYALAESGMIEAGSASFQNGIKYLINTQDKTGAWILPTRSSPIQPFVNSDFPPYDDDQFISAAASNWAVLALADALPEKK